MHHAYSRRRAGITFIEQLAILALVGVLLAISVATGARLLDRAAVSAASREIGTIFSAARDHAVSAGQRTAVRIVESDGRLVVHVSDDTLSRHPLGETHGVEVSSTRDSMAYAPSGMGWGASNLRIVVTRGAAADTITVSRLGRVRRG